jgi:23S rRNA pseudouridine1911/1915/1917 synthase
VTARTVVVPPDAAGRRLDQFLAAQLPEFSRAQLQHFISAASVRVDGKPAKPSERLRAGQSVEIAVPPPAPAGIVPREMPLSIVYESSDFIVVDKPAGLVVHPAPGHADDTLANALMARFPGLAVGQALRPGIVHRLDKGTSGLMVVALTDTAYRFLAAGMAAREIHKGYLALVHGDLEHDHGTIEAPIGRDRRDRQRMGIVPGGREARTHFRVLERFGGFTLLKLVLETGRTHQIRVHLQGIGHPVVGDEVYGRKSPNLGLDRPFLHSWHLGLPLPGGEACLTLWAPLPPDLQEALDRLRAHHLA